ncbi:MAG: glycosyltransferase [Steroidobacteraceae bacterium]
MSRRTVLLIAFHFPPLRGISGIQRTLCFAKYLPRYGWDPVVLTVSSSAYKLVAPIDPEEQAYPFEVRRAYGMDVAGTLRVLGRYPRRLALPDRWSSWRYFAVRAALKLVREKPVDVVWSTFPIATAHMIGMDVARRAGIPWVAEFRDPMWQGDYPPEPAQNMAWKRLEADVFAHAQHVVVTTPGAAREYSTRFPEFESHRLSVIENGYDEPEFARAEASLPKRDLSSTTSGMVTLLHSGVIYPEERDPRHLFSAIASMKGKDPSITARLRLILRATGADARYTEMIEACGIGDIVQLAPAIDYASALAEMLTVDGLLILQAASCNSQIPAKIYEYMRAGRPIVALTDPDGDTADALRSVGVSLIARLDSAAEIEAALIDFIQQRAQGHSSAPDPIALRSYARENQAGRLAAEFDELCRTRRRSGP